MRVTDLLHSIATSCAIIAEAQVQERLNTLGRMQGELAELPEAKRLEPLIDHWMQLGNEVSEVRNRLRLAGHE